MERNENSKKQRSRMKQTKTEKEEGRKLRETGEREKLKNRVSERYSQVHVDIEHYRERGQSERGQERNKGREGEIVRKGI